MGNNKIKTFIKYIKDYFLFLIIEVKKKVKKEKNIRDADLLFREGKIDKATDVELNEILKKISSDTLSNDARVISRCLIINTIRSQRHIDRIEARNRILTYAIICLTAMSLVFSYIAIQPIIEERNARIRRMEYQCKNNPTARWLLDDGTEITCEDVLKNK